MGISTCALIGIIIPYRDTYKLRESIIMTCQFLDEMKNIYKIARCKI